MAQSLSHAYPRLRLDVRYLGASGAPHRIGASRVSWTVLRQPLTIGWQAHLITPTELAGLQAVFTEVIRHYLGCVEKPELPFD